jgi:hypothetical protein
MKKSLLLGILAVVILLVGAVAYANADSVTVTKTGSGTAAQTATDTVHATAAINPKLILTVVTPNNTQTVDFGTRDPGDSAGPFPVSLTVSSNKNYNVTVDKTDPTLTSLGFSATLLDQLNQPAGALAPFTDQYSVAIPWTTAPGSYTANVKYTVVQL